MQQVKRELVQGKGKQCKGIKDNKDKVKETVPIRGYVFISSE
jgi:hypothetical protein